MEAAATPPDFGHAVQSRDETPSGDRIAIATSAYLVCLDRAGAELWRFDFGPSTGERANARTNCRFSLDGTAVWLYRPDLYSGHGEIDRWFALDAATGAILGDAALPTYGGHGGYHVVHPDGVHVLLEVGCGQDGSYLFKGWIDDGVMTSAPWPVADDPHQCDQRIAALSSDGGQVMAFEHDDAAVTFRDFPSGAVQWQIALQDFGFDLDSDQIETIFLWSGRYVDDRIAMVEFKGETGELDEDDEDEPAWAADGLGEWEDYRAYVAIDLQARRVLGPADADGAHTGDHPRFVPEP
ncbi:hypothetical protein O1R50_04805 [Glycomyces luteolus]|uniref:Uncharacterized protein n=1 Tax=Glycomyces luteolus TaxID=2670330 RepID=A0A9X3P6C6_9ACTN|nr:hypothetical protein [Glycomyces luteolus]MDA1358929.1 hypothetical protein [Glycomyces luteolus]